MRLPVHIWIREENANPAEIAGYFTAIAQRLDERPQKMRLVVESSVIAVLDFDPKDGNPVVMVGGEVHKFDIRRRWLPEHPVPLEFGRRPVVLLFDPLDGNRFRVRSRRRIVFPGWLYAVFAVSASVSAVTLHPAVIVITVLVSVAMASMVIWEKCGTERKLTRNTAV